MLKIHLFSIFTINTLRALNSEDTDRCTLTCTCSWCYQVWKRPTN